MQLIEVRNEDTAKEFIQVNVALHKNDPHYIRPLNKDMENVFNPTRNKAFRHGQCIRWILKDNQHNAIGRIAAFTNKKYRNKGDEQPTGGIGFFDCINDQSAANLLFDAARQWLRQQGMEAMDGPINFGERDRWWGLITEGFYAPMYGMNYNPPYYRNLIERYGFQPFFNQVCFAMKTKQRLGDKFYKRHTHISNNPDFTTRHIRKDQIEKFAADFVQVYNKAWKSHGGGKDMHREQAIALFKTMKPVLDEKIIFFVYYKDEPIGCWISLPELNQYFKHFNGKFGVLQKLQFLWLKWTGACKKITGIVFGVIPEWQGKGIDAYMIIEGGKIVQAPDCPYEEYEMQWIGDFNPKMINVAESLGTYRSRVLTTYRYLFDRNKEFKRHPILA